MGYASYSHESEVYVIPSSDGKHPIWVINVDPKARSFSFVKPTYCLKSLEEMQDTLIKLERQGIAVPSHVHERIKSEFAVSVKSPDFHRFKGYLTRIEAAQSRQETS